MAVSVVSENTAYSRVLKVCETAFYQLEFDYSYKHWDMWVRIEIKGETDCITYVRPLSAKKNSQCFTLRLFKGENFVTVTKQLGDVFSVSDIRLLSEKPDLTPKITPKSDYFYTCDPLLKHISVTSFSGAPTEITCGEKRINFELVTDGRYHSCGFNEQEDDTFYHLYLHSEELLKLGVGKHNLKIHLPDGKCLSYQLNVLEKPKKRDLKIVCFDVNHANAVLITFPNGKNLLIDSGAENSAERVIFPYLKKQGIGVDYFLITHFHEDHEGSFDAVMSRYGFKTPDEKAATEMLKKAKEEREAFLSGYTHFNTTHLRRYDELHKIWDLGGAEVTVLNSRADEKGEKWTESKDENTTSMSLLVRYKDFGYYHGSDTYVQVQKKNLEDFKDWGKEKDFSCQAMLANHHFHGDASAEVLRAINPVCVVVATNQSAYARSAFVHDYAGEFLKEDFEGKRYKDTFVSYSSGTVIIGANSGDDWHYETY